MSGEQGSEPVGWEEPSHPPGEGLHLSEIQLKEPVDLREVEDVFACENMPDFWLEEWKAFRGRMEPGDELWDYFQWEAGPQDEIYDRREGYALVRGDQIVAHICLPFSDC
jgi:hypothetical protein